jgi:cell division inhibitor SulA
VPLRGEGTLLLFWFGFGTGNSHGCADGWMQTITTDDIYYLISAANLGSLMVFKRLLARKPSTIRDKTF